MYLSRLQRVGFSIFHDTSWTILNVRLFCISTGFWLLLTSIKKLITLNCQLASLSFAVPVYYNFLDFSETNTLYICPSKMKRRVFLVFQQTSMFVHSQWKHRTSAYLQSITLQVQNLKWYCQNLKILKVASKLYAKRLLLITSKAGLLTVLPPWHLPY